MNIQHWYCEKTKKQYNVLKATRSAETTASKEAGMVLVSQPLNRTIDYLLSVSRAGPSQQVPRNSRNSIQDGTMMEMKTSALSG